METLGYEYHKLRCPVCGRKILVEIGLIGVSHNAAVNAICAECLKRKGISPEFKKERPKAAADVEKWLGEQ